MRQSGLKLRSNRAGGAAAVLSKLEGQYAFWDPMLVWDGRRYLMYVMAMDRREARGDSSFFNRENAIHAFESRDFKVWTHLGVAMQPRTSGERLCAGNVLYHQGRYWFFCSATIEQCGDQFLDQRLFLAVSDDGVHFEEDPEFSLEPDPRVSPHNRFHPVDGRMLFAWRDPWPIYDTLNRRFIVFVCTGGERWGRPPDIVAAVAEKLAGPYELVGSVLDFPMGGGQEDIPAFGEIERVSVTQAHGQYFLAFSCWHRLVDETVLREHAVLDESLTDCSLYVAKAPSILGPYQFCKEQSAVIGASNTSGFYGGTFFSGRDSAHYVLGWNFSDFRIETRGLLRLEFTESIPGQISLRFQVPIYRRLREFSRRIFSIASIAERWFRIRRFKTSSRKPTLDAE